MAAKRKWSAEQLDVMHEMFYTDMPNKEVGAFFGCDYNRSIKGFWLSWFGEEALHDRFRASCARSKLGNLNPMYGKLGKEHPRYVENFINWQGYRFIDTPDWFTGSNNNGKVMEHVVVGCEKYGLTELPDGHVFHHIDEDKLNNSPDNLQLMTISAHMILHAELRRFLKA